MKKTRVKFDQVTKKFRRGQWSKSLRDAIPSLLSRWSGRKSSNDDLIEGEFYSLRDVSFEAYAGECLGIIGPNGAGKSTTLKLASRILKPNRGSVSVDGRVCALIEVGAGFHPDLTGRENIFLNGAILGMRRREIVRRFDEIVEFSGMNEFIDTPVKRYSSGMYARLGFSVAAHMDPDVLLLDEVLSVGDMAFGHKCQRRIKELIKGGAAVIFISHSLPAVRSICDRVLVYDQGRITFEGDADGAIHRYHEILGRGSGGSGKHPSVRRLSMRLTDQSGREPIAVSPGSSIKIEMNLVAERAIREGGLGFFVCNEQDVEVYASSIEELGFDPVDLRAGDTLSATFTLKTNLVPGTYWIGSIVFGKPDRDAFEGRATLDRHPNRLQWSVAGAVEASGSANLFAECDIKTERVSSSSTGAASETLHG